MKKKLLTIFLASVLFLSVSVYLAYAGLQAWQQTVQQKKLLQERRLAWLELEKALSQRVGAFRGEAGIIVEDLTTGWEYSYNKEKLFPSASIVKIPIMAACFQAVSEGRLDLKENIVLKSSSVTSGSGVLKCLPPGTPVPVEQLIEDMITRSDNTAANMLIERLGFDYLNAYFKKAGLAHTNLSRKMMDFEDRKYGVENYTTAEDISNILEKIYEHKLLSDKASEMCLAMLLRQKVNDRIPKKLPGDCPVAHKTGLEKNVCHDAGIVFMQQGDFLICVLTKSRAGTKQVKNFISDLALVIYRTYSQFPYKRGVNDVRPG